MKDEKLNQAEYALVEQTLRERVKSWSDQIDILQKQVADAQSTLEKIRTFCSVSGSGKQLQRSEPVLDALIDIFRDSKTVWVSSGYLRKQFKMRTGEDIHPNTLRRCLKQNKGKKFEMQGDRRFAKWKLIDKQTQ